MSNFEAVVKQLKYQYIFGKTFDKVLVGIKVMVFNKRWKTDKKLNFFNQKAVLFYGQAVFCVYIKIILLPKIIFCIKAV